MSEGRVKVAVGELVVEAALRSLGRPHNTCWFIAPLHWPSPSLMKQHFVLQQSCTLLQDNIKLDRDFYSNYNNFIKRYICSLTFIDLIPKHPSPNKIMIFGVFIKMPNLV